MNKDCFYTSISMEQYKRVFQYNNIDMLTLSIKYPIISMRNNKSAERIINNDIARIARHYANNHVESGGLTGTVWPQQTDNFPGVDGQADVFYHATAFIGFCKVLCS